MKNLILIVGKTASGKDTFAKELTRVCGFPQVVSYATRPIREGEVNGREHIFVTPERMRRILETESVLAYTKFQKTGYEYCATKEAIAAETAIYIIDPPGIEWLEKSHPELNMIKIFISLPEHIIRERAKQRGDADEAVEARLDSERSIFDAYEASGDYDILVENEYLDMAGLHEKVMDVAREAKTRFAA